MGKQDYNTNNLKQNENIIDIKRKDKAKKLVNLLMVCFVGGVLLGTTILYLTFIIFYFNHFTLFRVLCLLIYPTTFCIIALNYGDPTQLEKKYFYYTIFLAIFTLVFGFLDGHLNEKASNFLVKTTDNVLEIFKK